MRRLKNTFHSQNEIPFEVSSSLEFEYRVTTPPKSHYYYRQMKIHNREQVVFLSILRYVRVKGNLVWAPPLLGEFNLDFILKNLLLMEVSELTENWKNKLK